MGSDNSVPTPIGAELSRVRDRWQVLPLERATPLVPTVLDAVQRLADRCAAAQGRPPSPVPDLGPAVVIDQLRVMVYAACTLGLSAPDIEGELRGIRHRLV